MSLIAALPLGVLIFGLIVGVPIAVALAASGMLGIYVVTGDFSKVIGIVSLTPFGTVADYALTTIPMFILMAYLSASSGLARDLYTAAATGCRRCAAASPSPPCSPAASLARCRARASPRPP